MRMIGLAGWSGAGKTTLMAALLPELIRRGHTVSTIKHAHHNFDVDKPGKDSWVHREAGAREVLVASAQRFALMREHRGAPEPELTELLDHLARVDLVVIEGFKRDLHPKIEVWRPENGKELLHPSDSSIGAIATPEPGSFAVPRLALDDIGAIADWIEAHAMPVAAFRAAHKA